MSRFQMRIRLSCEMSMIDSALQRGREAGGIRKLRPGRRKASTTATTSRLGRRRVSAQISSQRARAAHAPRVRAEVGERLEHPLGDLPVRSCVRARGRPPRRAGRAPPSSCRSPRSGAGRSARPRRGGASHSSQVRIRACCRIGSWSGSSPTSLSSRSTRRGVISAPLTATGPEIALAPLLAGHPRDQVLAVVDRLGQPLELGAVADEVGAHRDHDVDRQLVLARPPPAAA